MNKRDPMARYARIANKFSTGKWFNYCIGPVVASQDAFFLFPIVSELGIYRGMALSGLGAIFEIENSMKGMARLGELDIANLPSAIVDDPEWPIKSREGRVIVIPRGAISRIHYPWWSVLRIETNEARFNIAPARIFRRRVLRVLDALNWHIGKAANNQQPQSH